VRDSEAAVIRECVRRVLAGEPIRSLARDLNGRGICTSTGRGRRMHEASSQWGYGAPGLSGSAWWWHRSATRCLEGEWSGR
jgi:hypothetical protein